MAIQYIFDLQDIRRPKWGGNKAEKLRYLLKKGFRVPATYVLTWVAYNRYVQNDPTLIEAIKTELSRKIDLGKSYAVRSSANIEDSLDHSFAGQFKSVLNVQGVDAIVQAIWFIWGTAQSAGVQAYLQKKAIDPAQLRMGILIQEMVSPVISGVAFSQNPMTGLDEVVIEAVKGSGEALVQEGITPRRWINKWGNWILKPDEEDVELGLVQEVVRQTKAIAKGYGRAVDLEWVYDGHRVYWVQLREITSANIALYSNRMSKELSAGVLKPLVGELGLIPTRAWVTLFTELIGPNDIDPHNLAKSFYYRIYYNMGAVGHVLELLGLPRETLELMMGVEQPGPDKPRFKPSRKTYWLLPRMLRVALDKLGYSSKISAFVPMMRAQYQALATAKLDQLSEQELVCEIDRLSALVEQVSYYTIVTILLMQVYNQLLKRQLGGLGVEFERFDLTRGMDELKQFDPNPHLAELNRQYRELDEPLQLHIRSSRYDEFCQLPGVEHLRQRIEQFREQFGYLRDSDIDFSLAPWGENPDLLLTMIVSYVLPDERSSVKTGYEDLHPSALRQALLRPIYQRARQFRFYREAIGFLHKFGYGLFRRYALALGERLAGRGIIDTREDVYYLYLDEIRSSVQSQGSESNRQSQITFRKLEMAECLNITPPGMIYGDQAPPLDNQTSGKLKGTPTSRGHFTGPVKVIQGITSFNKLQEGDVLVIQYSDVGWTPLFAKAGAVIAESGGLLSHSSIVAREYGIPAVVSVPGACRLEDGTLVTVDGYRGEVIVHERLGTRISPELALDTVQPF